MKRPRAPRHGGPDRRPVRRPRVLAALAASAVLLSGCEFNGLQSLPLPGGAGGRHPYHVTVEFRDVLDLVPRSAVKVDDVTVGTVEKVSLDGWHAKVLLRVDRSVRLPDNAVATIRQTSLLGEKFVSLAPPAGERPAGRLQDGDLIPLARSGRNVEVEEVLSALSLLLNGGGVAQLQTITRELNQALSGREDAVRDLLEQLDTLIGGLDKRRAEIVRAIENLDKLARTLAAQRRLIGQALERLTPGLKVLADERADLTRMLSALDRLGVVGSRVIEEAGDDLIADLEALRPILGRLNQAGSSLPNALELLLTFPFPRAATSAVRGDYTNLRVTADLDLRDLYDNLLGGGSGSGGSSGSGAAGSGSGGSGGAGGGSGAPGGAGGSGGGGSGGPEPPTTTSPPLCLPVLGCLP